MRVCVVTPRTELAQIDKRSLLTALDCGLEAEQVEEIFFVSYKLGAHERGARYRIVGPWEYQNPRVRLSRGLFRLLETWTWLPAWAAALPARLCPDELIEGLLACDPDVVVLHELPWASALRRLIHRRHRRWVCLTRGERPPHIRPRSVAGSPKVSIVLPTYNGVKYLRQSIESCLEQTLETIELIVVDDGSREDIRAIVEEYPDARIQYIRHARNRGLPAALNTGFRHSSGEYLTWTSDDNYFAEDAIERMVGFLQQHPDVDFVYADCVAIPGEENSTAPATVEHARLPETLRWGNRIGACFLYTRRVYEAIGEYDTECFLAEDYDYWLRVSKRFRMQRLFRALYYYRRHAQSLTEQYGQQAIAARTALARQKNRA